MKMLTQLPDDLLLKEMIVLPPTRQFLLKAECYIEINVLDADRHKFFEVDERCYMGVFISVDACRGYVIRNRETARGMTSTPGSEGYYKKEFIDIFIKSDSLRATGYITGQFGFNSFGFDY